MSLAALFRDFSRADAARWIAGGCRGATSSIRGWNSLSVVEGGAYASLSTFCFSADFTGYCARLQHLGRYSAVPKCRHPWLRVSPTARPV